jgi:uncharacterized membrane protein YedE/YeeE
LTGAAVFNLSNVKYAVWGALFGVVLVKAEVVSWLRIQEMFRLESFHMYGIIGSAVVVGAVSVQLIRRLGLRAVNGEPVTISKKAFTRGQVFVGLLFGFGWAMTGACPGPIFAQIGAGYSVVAVTFLSAWAGTWVYGRFRDRLPV